MHKLALFGLSALFTACLTAKQTTENEDDTAGTGGTAVSIYDIQTGVIAEGETVTLQNVVVTTTLTGDEEGFFVQDEGGGEWSGIYVFVGQAGGGIAPLVGDKVTLTGSVSEFYDSTQLVVSNAENMTVTGESAPVATELTSVDDWEVYEGCLVQLNDQTVASDVNSYGEVDLSFGISMDNTFFNFDTCYDASYESITGVITYSFEEYKINPRSQGDLAGGVEGECAATVSTVADVQSGDFENRTVSFENVVVTEAESDFDGYSVFWIQDQGAGEWSGLYVFVRANTAAAITVARGDVVNLTGMIEERYDQTQLVLNDPSDFEVVSQGGDITAEVLSASPADWENYEGVLITLENAEIGAGGQYGQYTFNNFDGIKLDDELFNYSVSEGDTVAALTGLVYFSYGEFTLLPRDADDMTGQEGGNGNNGGGNNGGTGGVVNVEDLRDGTVSLGSNVTLEDMVVTAFNDSAVFVQDATLTENAGITLFFGSDPFSVAVGDSVSVSGTVDEFYGWLQLESMTALQVTGSGTIAPTVMSAAPSNWEVYESMLVELQGVEITSGPTQYNEYETNMGILIDDTMFDTLPDNIAVGSTYNLTGVINYSYSQYRLNPRDVSDITAQ